MNFPSFDEFLSTIPTELPQEISEEVFRQIDKANKNDVNTYISLFGAKFAIELLRCYHDWLSEHLK